MANFDSSVDVIWGAAFDSSLGETMKVSILAAGFETDIKDDVGGNVNPVQIKVDTDEEKEREREEMIRIYGGDRLAQPSKNKFRVLLREEMDDDDAIEAISKPTFKRDPKSIYTPTLGEAPRPVKNDSDANAGKRITFG